MIVIAYARLVIDFVMIDVTMLYIVSSTEDVVDDLEDDRRRWIREVP